MIYSDGTKYVGQWSDNKYNDEGIKNDINNQKYIGQFSNDVFHGIGVYIDENKERYIGEFKNNTKNGEGIVYRYRLLRRFEKWENGYCSNSEIIGYGSLIDIVRTFKQTKDAVKQELSPKYGLLLGWISGLGIPTLGSLLCYIIFHSIQYSLVWFVLSSLLLYPIIFFVSLQKLGFKNRCTKVFMKMSIASIIIIALILVYIFYFNGGNFKFHL